MTTYFVVKTPRGCLDHTTVRYLRRDSIAEFMRWLPIHTWRQLYRQGYRQGYRCVRVKLVEVDVLSKGAHNENH